MAKKLTKKTTSKTKKTTKKACSPNPKRPKERGLTSLIPTKKPPKSVSLQKKVKKMYNEKKKVKIS